MRTMLLLAAQYNSMAVIPAETVRADYFPHLSAAAFRRKLVAGEISLPYVRMDDSQKGALGFHIEHLAEYIDAKAAQARADFVKMHGNMAVIGQ
jgi:hypothetical protein